jgi:quaternary ammonium compound-resistance protein SugE
VAWICLILAGALEVAWSYAMKESHGFSRLWPTLIVMVAMAGSLGLLALATITMKLGSSQ